MKLSPEPYMGLHAGATVVLMGTAWSLNRIPLELMKALQAEKDLVTIGCNRILRIYQPNYYCVADREPYSQEIERIRDFRGVRLLAETIFHRDLDTPHKAPVLPEPEIDWVAWRPTTHAMLGKPIERKMAMQGSVRVVQTDPRKPIISGANIAYCMLQWAIIMGARRIGFTGIDLTWESPEKSHFWGDGREEGCRPFANKVVLFHAACKKWLEANEPTVGPIEVKNLSPVPGPLDDIWGKADCQTWLTRSTS